jgi:hypothetical protein
MVPLIPDIDLISDKALKVLFDQNYCKIYSNSRFYGTAKVKKLTTFST